MNGHPIDVTGRTTDALPRAMDANLVGHMADLPARLPESTVIASPDLVLVDAGVPSDTFNVVCGAALDPDVADRRSAEVVEHFRRVGAPFTWWVGPTNRPTDLEGRLVKLGFAEAEAEVAMALDLTRLPAAVNLPSGVVIRRAETPSDLADFARVMAANWDPPDRAVVTFYRRAARVALEAGFPARFYVGYQDGVPVATGERFLGSGVAGLYAVNTRPGARRRGIGTAMTITPLIDARAQGFRAAVLQASVGGEPVYRRIGFSPIGHVREYKLPEGIVAPMANVLR